MASDPTTTDREFYLERIYIKDMSFESPQAPDIFTSDADTGIDLNVRSDTRGIDAETVEVTLTLTLESKFDGGATAFKIELAQAGLFKIKGFSPDDRFSLLATECPSMLFPYGRAAIATAANKGGFPELLLQPLDFHDLHARTMERDIQPSLSN